MKPSRGRMIAYAILIAVLPYHLLMNEYGPLDRFLEIGVLALIAYEVTVGGVLLSFCPRVSGLPTQTNQVSGESHSVRRRAFRADS